MAFGISSTIKARLRPKLGKRNRSSRSSVSSTSPAEDSNKRVKEAEPTEVVQAPPNAQLESQFLQKLPVEIRMTIYGYVWETSHRKYHIYTKYGHLAHAPCVMNSRHEDPDFIQKAMDQLHDMDDTDGLKDKRMRMWHTRLMSNWGHRHWSCEEYIEPSYHSGDSLDGTDFMSMMLVCKLMYPEVMESIFDSHTFIFNDLSSAHNFLVSRSSPFIRHLRRLDLTFSLSFAQYSPFIHCNGPLKENRLVAVEEALGKLICLHDLRISFDVWDRQCWRKLPEQRIVEKLRTLRVLKKFVIELPPVLPTEVDCFEAENMAVVPFEIMRAPPLRYCMFHPPNVERFTWNTSDERNGLYWISAENIPYVPNPY